MTKMFLMANLGCMSLIMAQTESCMINLNVLENLSSPDNSSSDDSVNSSGDDVGGGGGNLLNMFTADLSAVGSSASGRTRYEVRTDQNRFDVEVESGVPGAVLDIVVDGVIVDQLTLDNLGFGEVEYRDPPDDNPDANEFPFPEGFPDIAEGTVVMVGDLAGTMTLITSTNPGGNSTPDDSNGNGDDIGGGGGNLLNLLTADLSAVGSSASGRARYEVRSDQNRFDVEVESGVPGAVLDIVVDGVIVDQLTLNNLGFGEAEYRDPPDDNPDANEFPFPEGFPDIAEGTIVMVGDLTGSLAP